MGRIITICRGDEHRAKIEKDFLINDIFADVYLRADTLVREITDELKQYDEETDRKHLIRYYGMGNNVITFCGERGQGKTSALQSFAKHLAGSSGKMSDEGSEIIEFMQSDDHYEVIDSIDPSAMENGESVLRVLISRLFFQLDRCTRSKGRFSEYDNEFIQNKESIVKLFEKCYQNIDYIKSGKCSDYEQDDLDTLSQLGSSAKLKTNLHDLIEKYLKMIAGSDYDEKKRRYLVIPIDDADLATKKVFELCEDIRNYLSIPNVIILMAVDYEQLVQATYQKYLKQYKIMWKAERQTGQKPYVVEKCHEMAAKYLEKVFPVTHRIDLPKIDHMLMEGYEDVKFEYIVPDKKKKGTTKHAFEELYPEDCNNLQDQLLEILYKRTGLVFVEHSRKMHLFLPHTLRELAHWVKMLYDMHEVDCDDFYQKYQNQNVENPCAKADIEKLKDNILMVKQYFMNYWCEKYLDISEVRVFQKIDHATRRKQMTEVKNILYDHLGKSPEASEAAHLKVIYNIVEKEFESESRFQEAVYIYYTIFLNEWFAAALEECSQFGLIARFVERIMDLSEYIDKGLQFQIDVNVLRGLLGEDTDPATQKALESFCVAMRNDKILESVHILGPGNNTVDLEPDNDFWMFDVLRPVIQSLKDFASPSGAKLSHDEVKIEYSESSCLIAVRNIVANCDLQWQIRNAVDSWCETITAKDQFSPLSERISKLCKAVDNGMGRPKSRKDKELAKIYENIGAKNNQVIDILFLCNKDNFERLVTYISNDLIQLKQEFIQSKDQNSLEKTNSYLIEMDNLRAKIEDGLNRITLLMAENNVKKGFELYKKVEGTNWEKIADLYGTMNNAKSWLEDLLKDNKLDKEEGQSILVGDNSSSVDQDDSKGDPNQNMFTNHKRKIGIDNQPVK